MFFRFLNLNSIIWVWEVPFKPKTLKNILAFPEEVYRSICINTNTEVYVSIKTFNWNLILGRGGNYGNNTLW